VLTVVLVGVRVVGAVTVAGGLVGGLVAAEHVLEGELAAGGMGWGGWWLVGDGRVVGVCGFAGAKSDASCGGAVGGWRDGVVAVRVGIGAWYGDRGELDRVHRALHIGLVRGLEVGVPREEDAARPGADGADEAG
jgi:hypothetical protein